VNEARLGFNLESVRIHASEDAALLADQLGAKALTYGADVLFGRDFYQPGTPVGQQLLAHELTHVRQQATRSPALAGTTPGSLVYSSQLEAEAQDAERASTLAPLAGQESNARATPSIASPVLQPSFLDDIEGVAGNVVSTAGAVGGDILSGVGNIAGRQAGGAQAIGHDVFNTVGDVASDIGAGIDTGTGGGGITGLIGNAWNTMQSVGSDVMGGVRHIARDEASTAQGVAGDVGGMLGNVMNHSGFGGLLNSVTDTGGGLLSDAEHFAGNVWNRVGAVGSDIATGVGGVMGDETRGAQTLGRDVLNTAGEVASDIGAGIDTGTGGGGITGLIGNAWNTMQSVGSDVMGGIRHVARDQGSTGRAVAGDVGGMLGNVMNDSGFGGLLNSVTDTGGGLLSDAEHFAGNVWNKASEIGSDVATGVGNWVAGWGQSPSAPSLPFPGAGDPDLPFPKVGGPLPGFPFPGFGGPSHRDLPSL
jgi:hypothetical protein